MKWHLLSLIRLWRTDGFYSYPFRGQEGAALPASLGTGSVHTSYQPHPEACATGGSLWWLLSRMTVWMRKWGLNRSGEWLSSICELYVFIIPHKQYIPVPSWSRWWHRWTSKQVNWINTLSDGTNQGVKQESTLVQAANAVGVTSWSQALWEPDSLSELQKEDNKVAHQHFQDFAALQ